jgi:hypothetical protein
MLSNIGLFKSVYVLFSCKPCLVILWMWNFSNVFTYLPFLNVCNICIVFSICPYACPVFSMCCANMDVSLLFRMACVCSLYLTLKGRVNARDEYISLV